MHILMLLCTAVACLFGLLVLLGLRGNLVSIFGRVVCLFFLFFLPVLATLILTVCCCRILDGHNSPFSAVFCSFRARFLLL